MSIPHETYQDDLPSYALGTLEPPATTRLERHLGECADCRRLLVEYEEVMRLLPLGLPRSEPSPAARRELFNRVRTDTAATRRGADGWWPRFRLPALATVAIIVAIVVGALFSSLGNHDEANNAAAVVAELQESPDTQIIPMLGSDAAPDAVAQLFFQPGETTAGLVVSGLPPLPDDRAYQLWFVQPDETRHDGGVFDVDSSGQAIVVIEAPADYAPGWRCGVTEEPAGGSEAPTGQNVMRGDYTDHEW
ncbi:MAG TPA: anti-sigma factor [Thermomicrobiales bacterium]|nr:anti-sigma factor [Thermomicrobiales bacterium]